MLERCWNCKYATNELPLVCRVSGDWVRVVGVCPHCKEERLSILELKRISPGSSPTREAMRSRTR